MAQRDLTVHLIGDSRSFERALGRGSKSAAKFDRDISRLGRGVLVGTGALSGLGRAASLASGAFLGGAGLTFALTSTLKVAGEFQQQLQVLQSVSGATADEMARASEIAKQLGRDITLPATSAKDAALAMTELGKAGLTVGEAMAAARGTLQLAAAASLEAGDAAKITAGALNAFQLSGSAAAQVADQLAAAANAAQGEIPDMALALRQSATVAHQFGLSSGEAITALTSLAKAGIQGSDAGTSLRVMLSRLVPQTKRSADEIKRLGVSAFDSRGQFLSIAEIIDKYQQALSNLTPVQRQQALLTIFGQDAQRAANIVLLQGAANFEELQKQVTKAGAASDFAAARNKGYIGSLDAFKSAVETLQIAIGTELLPTFTNALRQASAWVNRQEESGNAARQAASAISGLRDIVAAFSAVLVPTVRALGGLSNAVKLLVSVLVAQRILAFTGALTGLSTQALATTGRVTALRLALLRLAALGVIAVSIEVLFNKGKIQDSVNDFLRRIKLGFLTGGSIELPVDADRAELQQLRDRIASVKGESDGAVQALDKLIERVRKLDQQRLSQVNSQIEAVRGTIEAASARTENFGAKVEEVQKQQVKPPPRRPLTAGQRNQFFDLSIGRQLNRVQDITRLQNQVAALDRISALITAQIAKVKDVTRKLTLRDQLLDVQRQLRGVREQIAAAFLDSLQLGVDRAQATGTTSDDLAALSALEQGVRQQIRVSGSTNDLERQLLQIQQQRADIRREGRAAFLDALRFRLDRAAATASFTDDIAAAVAIENALKQQIQIEGRSLDLQRQLFEARQQRLDLQKQQRDARQFRTLGLGPTGEQPVPGARALRTQLESISDAVKGTFLDTGKTRSLLTNIRKLLSGGLGALSREVRQKIEEMLADIDRQLKDHEGQRTKFKVIDTDAFLRDLGIPLSAEDFKRARGRLSQLGAGGTVPTRGGTGGAFGFAIDVGDTNVTVKLNEREIGKATVKAAQKKARRRAASRRGVRPQTNTGLA